MALKYWRIVKRKYLTASDYSKIFSGKIKNDLVPPISRILAACMDAVDPYQVVYRALSVQGDKLKIDQRDYELEAYQRLLVVSFGKAAALMAQAVEDQLGERIEAGIVVDKNSHSTIDVNLPGKYTVIHSNHPLPGEKSLEAGQVILDLLDSSTPEDLVLFLISGGGSSLITAPYKGIELNEMQALTLSLLASGAAIEEINTVRKHLDRVKGGGLARAALPAQMVSLVLSDVVGNPLDSIASGPTVPDPTTFADAVSILKANKIWGRTPVSIKETMLAGVRGEISETLKVRDEDTNGAQVLLIGSNELAAQAGVGTAQSEGFNAYLHTNSLQGDAFAAGRQMGGLARQINAQGKPIQRPACVIAGGETTVVVSGDGLGGRNLEVALGAVDVLDGIEGVTLITFATDGEDGPTDAAGAIVTGETAQRAREYGLQIQEYRQNNDSYHYFETLNALIKTGSTGTNVNDLTFLFFE